MSCFYYLVMIGYQETETSWKVIVMVQLSFGESIDISLPVCVNSCAYRYEQERGLKGSKLSFSFEES